MMQKEENWQKAAIRLRSTLLLVEMNNKGEREGGREWDRVAIKSKCINISDVLCALLDFPKISTLGQIKQKKTSEIAQMVEQVLCDMFYKGS